VSYHQQRCYTNGYGDYRTDCSGLVSMAWGLGGPGDIWGTINLDDRSTRITAAQLLAGDALLRYTGDPAENHVAIFVRWHDTARTKPVVIEQTAGPGKAVERAWTTGFSGYTPVRYDRIYGGALRNDLDGNGAAEVLARDGNGAVHRYQGNGTGGFASGTGGIIQSDWSAYDIVFSVRDFDGDGDADVLGRDRLSQDLYVVPGNGLGGFGTARKVGTNWSAYDRIFAGGDFDRDGDADVLARHATTKDLHLFRGSGSGGFQPGTGDSFTNNWAAFDTIFAPGDWDGDGDVDIIARSAATQDLHLYRGNGSGGFQAGTGASFSNNWSAFDLFYSPGDFDGDGDPDIIARNRVSKDLHLYRGNGSGGFQSGTGASFSNNWSAFSVLF
jgi:hypothetical protein